MSELVEHLRGKADFAEELGYRDHAHALREAADEIVALRAKLFPYADATEIAGISWDGKYLIGDKASINFFHEMKNRGEQIDIYKGAYDERVAAKDAEIDKLRKALSEVLGYDRNFYDNGRPGYEAIARTALYGENADAL